MLVKIITGGQTGADQAAWRAAKAFGIPTGGRMPLGFLTEAGPRPEFVELYGAVEMTTASYAERTWQNVRDSDSTIWFGRANTPAAKATLEATSRLGKGGIPIYPDGLLRPSHVVQWLQANPHIKVLNIAGNRESKQPGIGGRVERFLAAVLRRLGHTEVV